MSENIEALRKAIGRLHADCNCNWCTAVSSADAALAAVEQEMAELRKRPTLDELGTFLSDELSGFTQDEFGIAMRAISHFYAEKAK